MGKCFSHLTFASRLMIERMLKAKFSIQQIAAAVGVADSTIYRERKRGRYMHRNSDLTETERYSPDIADKRYRGFLSSKGPELKIGRDFSLAARLEGLIRDEKYSPAAALAKIAENDEKYTVTLSRQTIYDYIDKGVLNLTNEDLPSKGKRRKKKKNEKRQARSAAGTSIEQRPEEIFLRDEFGHWEMDSVVGPQKSKDALLVLTERKTRKEIIFNQPDHTAASVVKSLDVLERKWGSLFPEVFKTITVDNGCEFADCSGMEHSALTKKRRTKIYYCHPYSSYERGTNEVTNRMIRRWIPKGTRFGHLKEEAIQKIEDWLNHYPRRIFGYETAEVRFKQELALIT